MMHGLTDEQKARHVARILDHKGTNRLLNGVVLPKEFNDPMRNLRLREEIGSILSLSGYFEIRQLAIASGGGFESIRTVLETLEQMGRLRPMYQICSKRTGHCLLIGLTEYPVFVNGVFKFKDSYGGWHRYREEKVYIVKDWQAPKKWRTE